VSEIIEYNKGYDPYFMVGGSGKSTYTGHLNKKTRKELKAKFALSKEQMRGFEETIECGTCNKPVCSVDDYSIHKEVFICGECRQMRSMIYGLED